MTDPLNFLKSVFLALGFLGLSCQSLWAADSKAAEKIEVEDAYVRLMPPGQPNTAAFFSLKSRDSKPHALVQARSDLAKAVELHTHLNEGGMMKMVKVEKIEVGANSSVQLKPGGHHVMFLGLKRPLKADTNVALTLVFEDKSEKKVQAVVRAIESEGENSSGHSGHHH